MHFYRGVRSHPKFRGDFRQFSSEAIRTVKTKTVHIPFQSELKNRLKRQNRSKSPRLTVLEKNYFEKIKNISDRPSLFRKGYVTLDSYTFFGLTESLYVCVAQLWVPHCRIVLVRNI